MTRGAVAGDNRGKSPCWTCPCPCQHIDPSTSPPKQWRPDWPRDCILRGVDDRLSMGNQEPQHWISLGSTKHDVPQTTTACTPPSSWPQSRRRCHLSCSWPAQKERLLNCLHNYENIINKDIEVHTLYYCYQVEVGPWTLAKASLARRRGRCRPLVWTTERIS
jgi:hypothetical protein